MANLLCASERQWRFAGTRMWRDALLITGRGCASVFELVVREYLEAWKVGATGWSSSADII